MKRFFHHLDDYLGVLALSGIIVLISANVFFRFVLNSPITWTEEVSLALFIWLTFIGISSGIKHNSHVGIDYFVRKMPGKIRHYVQVARLVVILAATILVFVYWGATFAFHGVAKVTPVLGISYTFINLAVPIGSLLAVFHLLNVFIKRDRAYIHQERGLE
ncbi:C4-dicarboxylate ABC transporter permease [Shouchella clausii]|jgi:TRAP-type transport system small permease protein|uniref:TRAP transporter small permease n=1 Tax=Shouchella TaxID=2893057 RepID=UPI000918A57C|nr:MULTISPECIES: TRAP transporter small permease [Shouchella]MBX0317447.1 TRAP transporter small permease [Shouchella clausii]MCM3380615.1 TRAP transporter small permease [Shouchella rhizosphaerae]MDO7283518.1 TRAP transporter small permease [Shouchella clausii]MDO7303614.1 TRAP transporter small permease [Shouchella clausii]PAE80105.1 TRAP transporter small permease [Shouchella clausii]